MVICCKMLIVTVDSDLCVCLLDNQLKQWPWVKSSQEPNTRRLLIDSWAASLPLCFSSSILFSGPRWSHHSHAFLCLKNERPSAISLAGVYSGLWFLWIPEGSSDPLPHQPLTISCLWLWGRVSVTLLRLDSSSFVRQLVVAPKFFCYTLPLRSFIPFFLLFT